MKEISCLISVIVLFTNLAYGKDAKDEMISFSGFWVDAYPVPDTSYGYDFELDGTFYYYNTENVNVLKKYSGSMGKWKIENNELLIKPEYDLMWSEKWYSMGGGWSPGNENKPRLVKSKYDKWIKIGSMVDYKKEDSLKNKPAMIKLKKIVNREVVNT